MVKVYPTLSGQVKVAEGLTPPQHRPYHWLIPPGVHFAESPRGTHRVRRSRGQPVEPDPGNAGAGSVVLFEPCRISLARFFSFRTERKVRHDVDASRPAGGDPPGDRPGGAIGTGVTGYAPRARRLRESRHPPQPETPRDPTRRRRRRALHQGERERR